MPIFPKPPRPDPLYCAVDIADFPVQALVAYDAALRGRPVVVTCQDATSHTSAAWSCSRQARELGVRPGAPVALVGRKFPRVAVVARNKELENAAREELLRVLVRYSPCFDVSADGKCCIDLTATPVSRAMTIQAIAAAIRKDIMAALPVAYMAIGLSQSPLLAQLMAKRERPDGVGVCERGAELTMLAGLDSALLPGLRAPTRERVEAYGLTSIGQIQRLGKETLVRHFGAEGERLYAMSMGVRFRAAANAASVPYAETVLQRDINDMGLLRDTVRYTVDKLCFLLKRENLCVNRFTFELVYGDNKAVRRTVALPQFTSEYLSIAGRACTAFTELYQRRVAIKTIRLSVRAPQIDSGQTDLFETAWDHKQKALAVQITRVREKLRFESVRSGAHVG